MFGRFVVISMLMITFSLMVSVGYSKTADVELKHTTRVSPGDSKPESPEIKKTTVNHKNNLNFETNNKIPIIISAIALMCSFLALYFSKKRITLMSEKNQADLTNTFWTGPLLIPLCIEPLKDFIITNEKSLKDLSENSDGMVDSHKNYINKFRKEINDISIRMTLISSLDQEAYSKIKNSSEELDDMVTRYCAYHSTTEELRIKFNKISFDDILISLYGFLQTTVQSIASIKYH